MTGILRLYKEVMKGLITCKRIQANKEQNLKLQKYCRQMYHVIMPSYASNISDPAVKCTPGKDNNEPLQQSPNSLKKEKYNSVNTTSTTINNSSSIGTIGEFNNTGNNNKPSQNSRLHVEAECEADSENLNNCCRPAIPQRSQTLNGISFYKFVINLVKNHNIPPWRIVFSNMAYPTLVQHIIHGPNEIQGMWIPIGVARRICSGFCYPIRYFWVPLFGNDFVTLCQERMTIFLITCNPFTKKTMTTKNKSQTTSEEVSSNLQKNSIQTQNLTHITISSRSPSPIIREKKIVTDNLLPRKRENIPKHQPVLKSFKSHPSCGIKHSEVKIKRNDMDTTIKKDSLKPYIIQSRNVQFHSITKIKINNDHSVKLPSIHNLIDDLLDTSSNTYNLIEDNSRPYGGNHKKRNIITSNSPQPTEKRLLSMQYEYFKNNKTQIPTDLGKNCFNNNPTSPLNINHSTISSVSSGNFSPLQYLDVTSSLRSENNLGCHDSSRNSFESDSQTLRNRGLPISTGSSINSHMFINNQDILPNITIPHRQLNHNILFSTHPPQIHSQGQTSNRHDQIGYIHMTQTQPLKEQQLTLPTFLQPSFSQEHNSKLAIDQQTSNKFDVSSTM